jgi:hypothetical protein
MAGWGWELRDLVKQGAQALCPWTTSIPEEAVSIKAILVAMSATQVKVMALPSVQVSSQRAACASISR